MSHIIKKARIYFRLILVVVIVLIYICITKKKIIDYDCNYIFFPRADLASIYLESGKKEYSSYIRDCSILGTNYQNQLYEYRYGFHMYEAEPLNKDWNVLHDSGKIITNTKKIDGVQTLFFDTCALEYNDAGIFKEQLTLQNSAPAEDIVLSYMCAVYVSPSGKLEVRYAPLDSNFVVVNTKDGKYYLKQICLFFAYKQKDYELQNEVIYQIKKDKDIVCEFKIQHIDTVKE